MKYMGSKRRIAKQIIQKMVDDNPDVEIFYDVMTGGGNLVEVVPKKYKRIAIDNNIYVIEALKQIRDDYTVLPKTNKEFTEKDYREIKTNKDKYPEYLVGFAGIGMSYGGKWFGGWCRGGNRDYVGEAYRNAKKQSPKIQNVEFYTASYDDFKYDKNSIIYFDPPYQNTTKYKNKIDYEKFWNFVRQLSKNGYNVYVSEYNAPNDFVSVWSKEQYSSLTQNTGSKKGVENLFVYKK